MPKCHRSHRTVQIEPRVLTMYKYTKEEGRSSFSKHAGIPKPRKLCVAKELELKVIGEKQLKKPE